MLRDLRVRILFVGMLSVVFYLLEPAFHQHGPVDPEFARDLSPIGISATLAYLAGLSMVVLLAGFVSTDFREGYAAIIFSHPTSPLAYFGLRWIVAFGVSMVAAIVFLLAGQTIAWGEVRGGAAGILLAALAALVYGSLMAFLSTLLRHGDGWVAFILFLPTPVPQILFWLEAGLPAPIYRVLLFLLPPQNAMQEVYRGLLLGNLPWPPIAFVAGYGLFWLVLAAATLQLRERF